VHVVVFRLRFGRAPGPTQMPMALAKDFAAVMDAAIGDEVGVGFAIGTFSGFSHFPPMRNTPRARDRIESQWVISLLEHPAGPVSMAHIRRCWGDDASGSNVQEIFAPFGGGSAALTTVRPPCENPPGQAWRESSDLGQSHSPVPAGPLVAAPTWGNPIAHARNRCREIRFYKRIGPSGGLALRCGTSWVRKWGDEKLISRGPLPGLAR